MPSSSQTCHQNPSSSKGSPAKRSNSSKSSISTPSKGSAHSSPSKSHSSGNSSSKSPSKRGTLNASSSKSSTNSSPTKYASDSCNYSMQQFSRTSSRTDLSDVYDVMDSPQNNANRSETLYNIPLSKIRTIMKTTQDPLFCSEEGLFAMTKATEEFIKLLTKGTYDMDPEANLLHYSSLANYVHKKESLDHLREIVPQRVKFSKIKESLMAARAEYEKSCD